MIRKSTRNPIFTSLPLVTDRGGGEVSVVSIRGLTDVTTTVNGRNVFTASGRAVALADVPSTLIKVRYNFGG